MAKKQKNNSLKNISRIDFKNAAGEIASGGWEVRIQRRGKRVEKFFADNGFGGRNKALAAAKKFRDEKLAGMKGYTTAELAKRPSKRNSSGVVGVRRHTQVDVRGEWQYEYAFWVAQWTGEDGKRHTRSFSVNRYGEDKALKMATKARNEGVKQANR